MIVEMDGVIIRDFRVFWMGHRGDIEHTYTLNKQLPKDVREKIAQPRGKPPTSISSRSKGKTTWMP